MQLTSKYLTAFATAAALALSASPALADDDPPPAPPVCFAPDGTQLPPAECPPEDPGRQASGH